MPRNGIAGSYASSLFIFLRKLHTDFHGGCTNLQRLRVPFFSFLFLMITILTGARWNCQVVSICVSFMVKDVEHSPCVYCQINHFNVNNSITFSTPNIYYATTTHFGFHHPKHFHHLQIKPYPYPLGSHCLVSPPP
jgi:hypothetical protein